MTFVVLLLLTLIRIKIVCGAILWRVVLIGYVWANAGKQAGLEKHVRVVDYSYPTLNC